MNATSPRQEYMNYRLTSEYWRQRRLDGIRIADEAGRAAVTSENRQGSSDEERTPTALLDTDAVGNTRVRLDLNHRRSNIVF